MTIQENVPPRLLVKNALLLVTCSDRRENFAGGNVYIEGREIRYAGPGLPPEADGCRVIDASGCLVLPGFVNTHHHLFQVLTRCLPQVQDADLFHWLTALYPVWAGLSPEGVYCSAAAGMAELLMTGCTTTADQMYLFPESQPGTLTENTIRAARELGMRFHPCHGSMSLGVSCGGLPPDNLVRGEDEILSESERLIAAYHDPGRFSLCRIALSPCAPFNVTGSILKHTAELARRRHVRLHTHLAETLDEETYCREHFGKRPLAYLADLGWTGEDVWYAHGIHFTDDEIALLARTGTSIAHCPTSNLRLGSGIAPVRRMRDAGITVGLAVDGSSSNDSSDMLGELRQCLLANRIKSGASSMPVDDVVWMATRGGAALLGRDDIGSLEAGKAADLVLWDMNRPAYAGAAVHDPLAALLMCGTSHEAKTVIVDGKIVVEDGRAAGLDLEDIVRRVNREAARLAGK